MLRVEQDRSGTNGAFAACKSVNQNREKTRLQNERCAQKTSGDAPRVMSRSRKKLFPPERAQPSNENKISDGWRESAWPLVEGGASWKVWDRDCQAFAASSG